MALQVDGITEIISRREPNGAAACCRRRVDGLVDGRRVESLAIAGGAESSYIERAPEASSPLSSQVPPERSRLFPRRSRRFPLQSSSENLFSRWAWQTLFLPVKGRLSGSAALPYEAAHRRLKESQDNVKREILTARFQQIPLVFSSILGVLSVSKRAFNSLDLTGYARTRQNLLIPFAAGHSGRDRSRAGGRFQLILEARSLIAA